MADRRARSQTRVAAAQAAARASFALGQPSIRNRFSFS
jgi:hypothetical protein